MNVKFCRGKVLSCMIASALVVAMFSFPAWAQDDAAPPPASPAGAAAAEDASIRAALVRASVAPRRPIPGR